MQALLMPAMAISFAVPAVAGQNFGGRQPARVRETFKQALVLELLAMALTVAACQHWAPQLVGWFTDDPRAAEAGVTILRIVSWNFFGTGVVFACSGMFQAMGNTLPALLSSTTRLVTFLVPALWLHGRSGFALSQVWVVSVASATAQALLSLALLRRQLGLRLGPLRLPVAASGQA
jgi:Na+-driven multidrug efflux pump